MTSALTTVARGDGSLIADPHRTIVRDPASWRALWAAHAGPEAPAPAVDFSAVVVAAAFAGERPSAGFQIEIRPGLWEGTRRLLDVVERQPAPGTVGAQMIVTPFHIVSLPRADGDVAFSDPTTATSGARVRTDSAVEARVPAPEPRRGGAFSEGVGPILAAERQSAYVRFHAWQSILGLGAIGLLALGLLAAAFAGLIVSPLLFTSLYRLSALTAVLWVLAWAAGVLTAALGHTWMMPLVGPMAEKRSRLAS
jgi:uncharacterized membrane protein